MTSPESLSFSVDADAFHANGFVLVKGVFSAAECERLRTTEVLDGVWDDPRMVKIARILLATPTPVFHLMTSFDGRDNEKVDPLSQRKIHHDARGTPQHIFNRRHQPGSYPVIRCGIYFQDFSRRDRSGALKVSPGSHKIDTSAFEEEALPYYNVPTAPGDVVVFMKRLLHSGHSLSRRADPEAAFSPTRENVELSRDPDQFLPVPPMREAMFIDYCDRSELADLNIKSEAVNPGHARSGLAERIPEFLARAAAAGLELRIDAALVECCDAVMKLRKPNGRVGAEALPAIQQFLALLPLAKEYSPHHAIWTGLAPGPDGCLQAIDRICAYRNTMATIDKDLHMLPRRPKSPAPENQISSRMNA